MNKRSLCLIAVSKFKSIFKIVDNKKQKNIIYG